MNLSGPFIRRPVATTLLTIAIALTGIFAFHFLPVASLPQIDFPTISVAAQLPGASAQVIASSVTTPLETQFSHIAGVTEMTSSSFTGASSITLQFELDRDINGAARDVEAAINAARNYLPSNLIANPTYRKVNPADAPIMVLSLTSQTQTKPAMYDAASTIIEQRLSQIQGVGQVLVGGSSLPAVRVELNPNQLNSFGLGVQDVASFLSGQNANLAKGELSDAHSTWTLIANDQLLQAKDYRSLVVGYHQGAAIRLSDIAQVDDSVQDLRSSGYQNGQPAVLLIIFKAPGANIIDTVQRVEAALPQLKASIQSGIDMKIVFDRTKTIRDSVRDVELALLVSIVLVVLVVFAFLRNARATLIPSVAVPVSLIGTFGVMYLLGYSLDNLSLMALAISTGFVVDDAIVVIENITRHLEKGHSPMEAAFLGAREIGFTVLSISISLIAVFIPILMMGGIVGRLLREFSVTLSIAIVVSLALSLTATPMMCSRLLRNPAEIKHGRIYRSSERVFAWLHDFYRRTLEIVLDHPRVTLAALLLTIVANVYLLAWVPKGFFPEQDNGTIFGGILGAQDMSFQAMDRLVQEFVKLIKSDPAVENVMAFTGGGRGPVNTGFAYVGLKPLSERKISSSRVIDRLRPKLISLPGATAFLQPGQDVRVGGRLSSAQYQYTIQSDSVEDLAKWGPVLYRAMKKLPQLRDVNSDQQNEGLQAQLIYDRQTSSRLGITPRLIDQTLYDSFGQSLVSTMYTPLNQYYVVMEAAPQYWQSPAGLRDTYVSSQRAGMVPLDAITHFEPAVAPLQVNHQGIFPSVTISFNLAAGIAEGGAVTAIHNLEQKLGMPSTIRGTFAGTLKAFQESLANEPLLIASALAAVYIVLGILYESTVHPITILSTLPSAGVGAALILLITHTDLSIVALIGMILLIGIVKKNAILMIDFAIAAERNEGKTPKDAIYEACLLRFRPILMTTTAALFGAFPLAFGTGMGAELRRPLGLTVIGGLIFSQALTLYTTPVVYLYLDRLRLWIRRHFRRGPSSRQALALSCLFFFTGCTVGPKYQRPEFATPASYKELGKEFRPAHPRDGVERLQGKWWERFDDPELDDLEKQVNLSNQNIAAAFASFMQARAMVAEARAQYFPRLSANPAVNSQGGQGIGSANPRTSFLNESYTSYQIPLEASWAPDLWGKVRNAVKAAEAQAQVSQADLANVQLTQQATLAQDYFELRAQDALIALYDSTLKAYAESLRLTRELLKTGIDNDEAVAQAEAQLTTTQAQATALRVARAQYEHAIAMLIGKPASEFSLGPASSRPDAGVPPQPEIPVGVPSDLLERRPDVAAAERAMAAANAQIGVAAAAFYPSLSLTGSIGIGSDSIAGLLAVPQEIWAVGASLAETIFDGGLRRATEEQYKAAYDQSVATYRQTVLTAFQQVEDGLSGLRVLDKQLGDQRSAIRSSRRYVNIATDRWKLGLDPYLDVLTAQISLLTNQQTEITIRMQQLTTAVSLIEALGGGWGGAH